MALADPIRIGELRLLKTCAADCSARLTCRATDPASSTTPATAATTSTVAAYRERPPTGGCTMRRPDQRLRQTTSFNTAQGEGF